MIIDAHAHAWPRWPHSPPVPGPGERGSIDNLVHSPADLPLILGGAMRSILDGTWRAAL